jgi:hypothetical protein
MTCDQSGSCEFQDLLRRYHVADPSPTLRHAHHEWDDEVQSDFEAGPGHDRSSGAIEIDLGEHRRVARARAERATGALRWNVRVAGGG